LRSTHSGHRLGTGEIRLVRRSQRAHQGNYVDKAPQLTLGGRRPHQPFEQLCRPGQPYIHPLCRRCQHPGGCQEVASAVEVQAWRNNATVEPLACMTDVLIKLVNLWPASRIDELMPWAYAARVKV